MPTKRSANPTSLSSPVVLDEDLECNSTSGDVRIGLPSGRTLDVDLNMLSGDIRSDFSPECGDGATARLRVRTVSGDIALLRSTGISTH